MTAQTWTTPAWRKRFMIAANLLSVPVLAFIVVMAVSNGSSLVFTTVFVVLALAIAAFNLRVMLLRTVWDASVDGAQVTLSGPITTWQGDATDLSGMGRMWVQGNSTYVTTPRGRLYLSPLMPDSLGLVAALKAANPEMATSGPA